MSDKLLTHNKLCCPNCLSIVCIFHKFLALFSYVRAASWRLYADAQRQACLSLTQTVALWPLSTPFVCYQKFSTISRALISIACNLNLASSLEPVASYIDNMHICLHIIFTSSTACFFFVMCLLFFWSFTVTCCRKCADK